MRRFFTDEISANQGLVSIEGSEAKHIARVLRMEKGDRFILIDGKGGRFQAIIDSVGHHRVTAKLEKSLPTPPPSPVHITLCQASIKSKNMDFILQKTSEVGVNRIYFFQSDRAIIRLNGERLKNKIRHWREISHSAMKQADRIVPAEIEYTSSFKALISKVRVEDALKVIMWEEEKSKDLKRLLRRNRSTEYFIGIIGPEGGFSTKEIQLARDAGFLTVSLGNRILRSETAAISMVAIVQYEWGDLSLPGSKMTRLKTEK